MSAEKVVFVDCVVDILHRILTRLAPTDFKDFYILLIGRLLGGIATSLLFSIFEAWLIRAHADAKLKSWISKSFTWAAYGNSIIAIAAGLLANHAAESTSMTPVVEGVMYVGGYLEPFDIALVVSLACGLAAMQLWEENYGEETIDDTERTSPKWYDGLRTAFTATVRSPEIFLCGSVISLFEGSMYVSTMHCVYICSCYDHSVCGILSTFYRFLSSCGLQR